MKSRLFKMCAWTLVLVLLVNMIPAQVLGAGTQAAETKEVVASENQNDGVAVRDTIVDSNLNKSVNENAIILAEIVEHRTEFSKEYILSNGTNMAVVYPEPVHFQKDGRWEDIDNTLKAVGSGDSAVYTNTADAWQVMLPQKLGKNAQISISKDGYTVSFRLTGEIKTDAELTANAFSLSGTHQGMNMRVTEARDTNGQAQLFDYTEEKAKTKHPETIRDKLKSRVTYSNVYQNTDIVYDLNSHQLKESIVINEYDASLYGYRYALETGALNPVLNDDGSIDLYAPNTNEVIMTMPAPYMIDDAGVVCNDVSVTLEQSNGAYVLTYAMPMQWLADTTRAWPVVLDPIVSKSGHYNNVQDKTVMELASTSYTDSLNQCGWRTGNGIMQCYVLFDTLPELSSADIIVDASVAMYKPVTSYDPTIVEVRKVTNSWTSETLTWSNKPNVGGIIEDFATVQNEGYYYWNITDIARGWYETGINSGMVFKAPDSVESAAVTSFTQFKSSDYDKYHPEYGPTLYIVFRNSNGLESYWNYTSAAAGRAGTGYVNNYTGNLTWTHSDIGFGGNRMPVSINHIYNANDYRNNSFGLGYGWRTNYNQVIGLWSSSTNAGDLQETVQQHYYWQDGDGTKHYFVTDDDGALVDEDGLNLTLTVGTDSYTITDQYGNTSVFEKFTNSSDTTIVGRLVSLSNNQKVKSTISITYANSTGMLISKITDGVNRAYNFTYSSDLLSRISYTGTGTSEVAYVSFGYGNAQLTTITNQDGNVSQYTYSLFYTNTEDGANEMPLLHTVTDVDGYKIQYTYCAAAPHRIAAIAEYDGAVNGSSLSIEYAHNQTTLTDHNSNTQILQFNDWGNVVTIQDSEGRAKFAQYALNGYDEEAEDATVKGNQLRLSSKMQNTVANLQRDTNFEKNNPWTALSDEISRTRTSSTYYMGAMSMRMNRSAAGTATGVYAAAITVGAGQSCTFSAYVKTDSDANAYLAFALNGTVVATSETLTNVTEWTRIQVSYTNTSSAPISLTPQFLTTTAGSVYMDCVQIEIAPTASRHNLVENSDFSLAGYWSSSSGRTTLVDANGDPDTATPQLSNYVYSITGDPGAAQSITQTLKVNGTAGDTLILSGWAKGDAAPLTSEEREFGMKLTFNYADGTTSDQTVSFNTSCDSQNNWQYAAVPAVATGDYSTVTVELMYNYNVNTVYFDGIQLFKEEFGSSYAYDADGNVTTVIDLQRQQTTYEYNDSGDLTKILQGNKAKMTYTYDEWHNVKTATTEEGVVYEFAYDDWGNNTSVSITSGGATITSTATYSTDGNILVSTKNALDKTTQYGYNINTNVLEWVQYPEDDENTRTEYSYDSMYRLATATADVDSGYSLDAAYTYTDDLLTQIGTNSTIYSFTYGDFAQRSTIEMGEWSLASYDYTDDQNRYLDKLTYGNGDFVNYTYDAYGRVTAETFEDGDTVTYEYDNTGALATVTDSSTGIKTSYYYDLTDRLMKYVESDGTNTHSVGYEYDTLNNLTLLVETINGVPHTTSYAYDDDNRVTSVTASLGGGSTKKEYTYDNFGRVGNRVTSHNGANILTESFNFRSLNEMSTTGQIASVAYAFGGSNVTYSYTYDGNGNITSVSDGTYVTTYVYDSANQLTRENNQAAGKTWVWTYDDAGNILTKQEYAYTTGTLGTVVDTITYTYSDSDWGDLLTGYGDETIRYDSIGNPILDGTWTYTWGHGRELESMFRVLTGGTHNTGLQVEMDSTGVKNGLFLDSDGEIRYYVNGRATYMGLIYVNGYYYYIRSSAVAVRNASYWVTDNNGLMESATHHFDAYGRMTDPPDGSYIADVGGTGMQVDYTYNADGLRKTKTVTTGELVSIPRDGLRWDEDGELRYYRNGYLTRVGLIYVDGHYYYIKSDGTAVRNQEYWISHNNGLLPNQDYIFNEYGWLTNPESDKEIEVKMSTNNAVSADMYFDWTLNPGTATSVTYTYTYNGGTLAQMTGGGDTLSFSYDASGKPMAVIWGTTTYLYLTNLQGDVIAILDTAGNQVVQYTYDAWGKILTTTGTLADTLGTLNPITYRGYVYDTETGLYYVSSRYYDSVWGRFLNADVLISTGQGLLGNNMFAYCRNNPVCRKDITGTTDVALLEDGTNLLDEEKSLQGGKISNGDFGGNGSKISGSLSFPSPNTGNGYNTGHSIGVGQAPKQGASGSTYTQISSDGKGQTVSVTTYGAYDRPFTRVDYLGRDHHVGLPHIHRFGWGYYNGDIRQTGEAVVPYIKE